MIVSGDGTAAIMDLNKLAFYTRDGACRKELSLAKMRSFRMKFDRSGFIYLDSWDYGPDPATKTVKQSYKITKYDGDLKLLKTYPIAEETATMGSLNLFTPILYFHVTGDDDIIWAMTSAYEFTVLNQDGRQIRKITKDYDPRRITAADEKELLKERFGDQQIPAGMKSSFLRPTRRSSISSATKKGGFMPGRPSRTAKAERGSTSSIPMADTSPGHRSPKTR